MHFIPALLVGKCILYLHFYLEVQRSAKKCKEVQRSAKKCIFYPAKFGTFVNKISMAIGMRIHTKSAGHIFSSFFGFVK